MLSKQDWVVAAKASPSGSQYADEELGSYWEENFSEKYEIQETGDLSAGLQSGYASAAGLIDWGQAAFFDAIGAVERRDANIVEAEANDLEAAKFSEGRISKVEDIDGVGDAIDWFQFNMAAVVPNLAETAISAGIGSVVGGGLNPVGAVAGIAYKGAIKDLVKNYAQEGIEATVAKELAESQIENYIKNFTKEEFKDSATDLLVGQAIKANMKSVSAAMGAAAAGYAGMGVGDLYSTSVEAGDPSPFLALAGAVPYAGLDYVGGKVITDKLFRGGRVAGDDTLKGRLKNTGGTIAVGVPAEAATELGQEELNIQLQSYLDPTYDSTGEEAMSRRLNAAAAGGLIGGGLSTSQIFTKPPEVRDAIVANEMLTQDARTSLDSGNVKSLEQIQKELVIKRDLNIVLKNNETLEQRLEEIKKAEEKELDEQAERETRSAQAVIDVEEKLNAIFAGVGATKDGISDAQLAEFIVETNTQKPDDILSKDNKPFKTINGALTSARILHPEKKLAPITISPGQVVLRRISRTGQAQIPYSPGGTLPITVTPGGVAITDKNLRDGVQYNRDKGLGPDSSNTPPPVTTEQKNLDNFNPPPRVVLSEGVRENYGKVFENIEADDNSQKLSDENILSPAQIELARKNTESIELQKAYNLAIAANAANAEAAANAANAEAPTIAIAEAEQTGAMASALINSGIPKARPDLQFKKNGNLFNKEEAIAALEGKRDKKPGYNYTVVGHSLVKVDGTETGYAIQETLIDADINESAQKTQPTFTPDPGLGPKSRSIAITMSPSEFLNLTPDQTDAQVDLDSMKYQREQIAKGEPLETPILLFELDDKGVATVVGHEGRNRSQLLIEMGITEMPVVLKSQGGKEIRWSEQTDLTKRDRIKVPWPTTLKPQEDSSGNAIAFPVSDPSISTETGQNDIPPIDVSNVETLTGPEIKSIALTPKEQDKADRAKKTIINKNMSQLGNDIRLSKGNDVEGQTIEQAELVLREDKNLAKLIDDGKLEVNSTDQVTEQGQDQLFSEGETVQGLYRDGVATVFADNNNADTTRATAWHEVFHAAVDTLPPKVRTDLLDRLGKLSVDKKSQWVVDAMAAMPDSTSDTNFNEELGAYAVTQYTLENNNLPTGVINWVKDVIAKIKASVYKNTGILIGALDPVMLKAIAKGWKGEGVSQDGSLKMSVASSETDTPKTISPSEIEMMFNGARKKMKRWVQKMLVPEGLVGKKVYEKKTDSDAVKNVGESEVEYISQSLRNMVKKAFNVKNYSDVSIDDARKINAYLGGRDTYQNSATNVEESYTLNSDVKKAADEMRTLLDVQSEGMVRTITEQLELEVQSLNAEQYDEYQLWLETNGQEGSLSTERLIKAHNLMDTIVANKGSYLHRSYQAFDDPKWMDKARKDETIMGDAMDHIREISPDLTEDQVRGKVLAILRSAQKRGDMTSFLSIGTMQGSKDTTLLRKKDNTIAPAILRLLGEHKDPIVNFSKSSSKMQWYIADHDFNMAVRKEGLGTFLFERSEVNESGEFIEQIAPKGDESLSPLDGLYTTPDFIEGLQDLRERNVSSELVNSLISANSVVKYGKTILSPTTQFRNFMSAAMFSVMSGHLNWSHGKTAFKATKSDLFHNDTIHRSYMNRLIKLKVVHDNAYAGELKDALKDFYQQQSLPSSTETGVRGVGKQFLNYSQKFYQAGDDFWKVIGFENELKRQLDAAGFSKPEEAARINAYLKGDTDIVLSAADKELVDAAEAKAAYRIRNGYPTYSSVPKGMRWLRRFPLAGTFVSFPYEIARTTINNVGFIKEDYNSSNPVIKKHAVERILGMAVASSAAYAASKMSMMLMGLTDEDDEAIKLAAPEWSRNSNFLYSGFDKDGLPTFLDLSSLDPYTYLKKPIAAIMSGNNETVSDKLEDAITEILQPFIGVDIAAGALFEVASNSRLNGGRIYNPVDSGGEQMVDVMNHIRKAIQPGVMSNIERSWKAISGSRSRTGREFKMSDEALAFIGFRFTTMNLPQSLVYKGYGFQDGIRNSKEILSRAAGSREKLSADEVTSAFDRSLSGREETFQEMIKIVGGMRTMGITDERLRMSLRSAGVSNRNVSAILRGEVPNFRVSSQFIKGARDRAKASSTSPKQEREVMKEFAERRKLVIKLAREASVLNESK